MGHFGGVLSFLKHYWGLLGFSYYDSNDQLFCNVDLVVASTKGMKSASSLKYSLKIPRSPFRSSRAKLSANTVTQVSSA